MPTKSPGSLPPLGFMSYVHLDDEHENGRITQLRERLSAEVRLQTGDEFPIFQDRSDIRWGENWQRRIENSLDSTSFLVPIVTPGFFSSEACRAEVLRFLEREKELRRDDLILPIYYAECPVLSDEDSTKNDPVATAIAAHQYMDWRDLRFEPFASPSVGRAIAAMAAQIKLAIPGAPLPKERMPAPPTGRSRSAAVASSQREASAQETASPIRTTDPPTRYVDAMHRGDHASIAAAISAASPGDRIIVRPGLYEESLVIDKALEIIGEGPSGDVVLKGTADTSTIAFRANMGRIANITIRQPPGEKTRYAVSIEQGRLDLEQCDISSDNAAAVAIRGGSDPRVRRNRIHDGKQGGVYVNENGQGLLEDNEIFGNALAGVEIKEGGNPTLRRNRITENGHEAVWISDGGGGTFIDNDLRGNRRGAWDIADGCEPLVQRRGNIDDEDPRPIKAGV